MDFSSLKRLFRPKYLKSTQVPPDLPVEIWRMYLDPDLNTGIRRLIISTTWSDPENLVKGVKVPSVCNHDNPFVYVVISVLGKKEDLMVKYDKDTFIRKWGEVPEAESEEDTIAWMTTLHDYYKGALASVQALNAALQNFQDQLNPYR